MEEKLVKVLLDQYKEKGVDMYALLDDNFFKGLSMPVKVDLIKKYASHISSGTARTLTKKDIRTLIFDAGFTGILTGVTAGMAARKAGQFFTKGVTPMAAIAGAVLLGAGMAAGSTYLGSRRLVSQRAEILKRIDAAVKDPSDENALRVLTTRNTQLNPIVNASINSSAGAHLASATKNLPNIVMEQIDPVVNYLSFKHNWDHQTNEYAPGVNTEVYERETNKSHKDMLDSFQSSLDRMQKTILGRN